MLAHDIHVVDLGGDNWDRLMTTLTDLGNLLAPEGKGKTLLVVYRGLACLKAIDLTEQREVSVPFRGTSRLDALAAETGYDLVPAPRALPGGSHHRLPRGLLRRLVGSHTRGSGGVAPYDIHLPGGPSPASGSALQVHGTRPEGVRSR